MSVMHALFPKFRLWYLLVAVIAPLSAAQAEGTTHTDPAGLGVPVKSIVEIGVVAASNYDVTITVLETVRGKEAMARLQSADAATPPAPAEYEYLLARVRFALQGRAVSNQGAFDLGSSPFQWVANSADLRQYDGVAAKPPKPVLQGAVGPGQSVEGWLVFAVEASESTPILIFDPSSGGATGRGKMLFFKLY